MDNKIDKTIIGFRENGTPILMPNLPESYEVDNKVFMIGTSGKGHSTYLDKHDK